MDKIKKYLKNKRIIDIKLEKNKISIESLATMKNQQQYKILYKKLGGKIKKGKKITKKQIEDKLKEEKKKIKKEKKINNDIKKEVLNNKPNKYRSKDEYMNHLIELNKLSEEKIEERIKIEEKYFKKDCNKDYKEYKDYEKKNNINPLNLKKCSNKKEKKENYYLREKYITAKSKRSAYKQKCVIKKKDLITPIDNNIIERHDFPIMNYNVEINNCNKIINSDDSKIKSITKALMNLKL